MKCQTGLRTQTAKRQKSSNKNLIIKDKKAYRKKGISIFIFLNQMADEKWAHNEIGY